MRVALLRHPSPLIEKGICYGRTDLALHPRAGAEMAAMRQALTGFAATTLWCSPAQRCRLAVEHVTPGLTPRFDERLLELDFGSWEDVAWNNVPRALLDEWAADPLAFAPPGGESGAALIARVASFYADLIRDGHDCIVLSHGGPLKLLRALLVDEPPDLMSPSPAIASVTIVQQAGSTQQPR